MLVRSMRFFSPRHHKKKYDVTCRDQNEYWKVDWRSPATLRIFFGSHLKFLLPTDEDRLVSKTSLRQQLAAAIGETQDDVY
jgi:hypothetical protein